MKSLKNIEEKFNKSQDSLVLQQSDLSLKSISDMVRNGAIDINPKYQRRLRWDSKKESDLIESFIINIPVPPIYLAEDEYGTYSVIDGKQRITAIHNFLTGKIELKKPERFPELDGFKYDELPTNIKNALQIRPYLRVVTLLRQSDNELKHEVFLRLNKAGVALNSQEIRNVAFRGKFNDLLFELSQNQYFNLRIKATPDSTAYREMIDVQFVLRFFTVKAFWENFQGNMDIAMDDFMKKNYRNNEAKNDFLKNDFLRSLNACSIIWGKNAFLKPNGSKKVLQGFFDIQMVCLSLLSDLELNRLIAQPERVRQLLIDEMENNPDFIDSLTQFTSNAKNMRLRIGRFLEILRTI
jgi:hypothetical protein